MADPCRFSERILDLFSALHPLDRVPRAGFLLRGVPEPESVAAHSHFMALLALLFLQEFPGRWDPARTLSMALLHDLPEARLMDIPMPVAEKWFGAAKAHAEDGVFSELFSGFPASLQELHDEYDQAQTEEAKLLRALDKAQMMLKVLGYEKERRGGLEEFWKNPGNFNDYGIAPVSDLFDAICARQGLSRPDTLPLMESSISRTQ